MFHFWTALRFYQRTQLVNKWTMVVCNQCDETHCGLCEGAAIRSKEMHVTNSTGIPLVPVTVMVASPDDRVQEKAVNIFDGRSKDIPAADGQNLVVAAQLTASNDGFVRWGFAYASKDKWINVKRGSSDFLELEVSDPPKK